MIGIYKITSPSGKVYIGQSINVNKRMNDYKKLQDCKKQTALYNSFLKYGTDKHTFEIVTECTIKELNNLERYYQDLYDVTNPKIGLNCRLTASDERCGELSEEHKSKISKSMLGKKHTNETKDKMKELMKGRNTWMVGKKHTEDTKLKMSKTKKGKKMSEESKRKMSERQQNGKAYWFGKKMSQEHKNKMSRKVIDLETGFFYDSAEECLNHNREYLKNIALKSFNNKLNGNARNNTKFEYVFEEIKQKNN
jgi:group I intron endonuclease